jgi:hypothetical protein
VSARHVISKAKLDQRQALWRRLSIGVQAVLLSWRRTSAREAEADRTVQLLLLAAQERKGQVDPFDLAEPALVLSAPPAEIQVSFAVVESDNHLRVDLKHRAADTGFPELSAGSRRMSCQAQPCR